MALPISSPGIAMEERGAAFIGVGIHLGHDVWIITHAGVPTGGDGWAGVGSLAIDRTNGELYTNTGTKASPTWTNQT